MGLPLKTAKILARLSKGETIANSLAKSAVIDELVTENILFRKGKHKKTLELKSKTGLTNFLGNQLQINNLEKYILVLEKGDATRATLTKIATDSKKSKERAFKGFLVNSYDTIKATLHKEAFTVHPKKGSFVFVYDFETFKVPEDITIVGVENAKNFSEIQNQRYLFKDINPLFISRYPQNQNKDFIKWMKSIPNKYLHFGDFDKAGIGIYLNEYKKHLLHSATFFIPDTIALDLKEHGNRERFNKQKFAFKIEAITETRLLEVIALINIEKKGLDQEFYIRS